MSDERIPGPLQDDLGDFRLDGQVALITGGAGGIGRASAALMARRGAHVVIMDSDGERLAETIAELAAGGMTVAPVVGSVALAADCHDAVEACISRWGRIDMLVNSAGIGGGNYAIIDMPEDRWRSVMDVNALGTFLACQAALPHMVEAGYGRIVNVASIAGMEGNPRASHYSASKAAVVAFTKSLGKEMATTGVVANAIAPAVIETELLDQVTEEQIAYMLAKIPMARFGTPEEVARLVCFLASPQLTFSTGAVYDLSGGRATY
jgi:3-oxoacyl-[acyl-carrier protein] reductase